MDTENTTTEEDFDFTALVGLDELSSEERAVAAAEIGLVLYKRALLTMLSEFDEAGQQAFAAFLETLPADADAVTATIARYPQLATYIAHEGQAYRELAATVLDHEAAV